MSEFWPVEGDVFSAWEKLVEQESPHAWGTQNGRQVHSVALCHKTAPGAAMKAISMVADAVNPTSAAVYAVAIRSYSGIERRLLARVSSPNPAITFKQEHPFAGQESGATAEAECRIPRKPNASLEPIIGELRFDIVPQRTGFIPEDSVLISGEVEVVREHKDDLVHSFKTKLDV